MNIFFVDEKFQNFTADGAPGAIGTTSQAYTDIDEAQGAFHAAVAGYYNRASRENNLWARVTLETMEGGIIENKFIPGVAYGVNKDEAR